MYGGILYFSKQSEYCKPYHFIHQSPTIKANDSVCILREMFEVREGRAKCDIFNIDDVEFIINDLCVN